MSKVVQTTKCDVCGKNVTEQEESSGVHLCPTDKAYHNVGIALKVQKEREAAAKKVAVEDTKEETKK